MSGPPGDGEPSQADLATKVQSTALGADFVVIACFDCLDDDLPMWKLPTVLQTQGYAMTHLETAARFLFDSSVPPLHPIFGDISEVTRQQWQVETSGLGDDMTAIHQLWHDCLPARFRISQSILGALLHRASILCFVVRQPTTREVLGFCVILTAGDNINDKPDFGSLAALVVRTECRGRGIGTHLHDAGIAALGARDVRLGSTFPRLLHGIPDDSRFRGWFARRGWHAPSSNNQDASDWLLDLGDFAGTGVSMAELSFQRCTPSDRDKVVNLVSGVSKRQSNLGWNSQYTRLADSKFIGDIIVGFEGATVVSAGILCVGSVDHPFVQDMPWAQAIGTGVGSLSCICITDPVPGIVNDRGSIMGALLEYCVKSLARDGCKHMFLDAVGGGDHDLPDLGFRRWSRYADLWKQAA